MIELKPRHIEFLKACGLSTQQICNRLGCTLEELRQALAEMQRYPGNYIGPCRIVTHKKGLVFAV